MTTATVTTEATDVRLHPAWVELVERRKRILLNRPERIVNLRQVGQANRAYSAVEGKVWNLLVNGKTASNWFKKHLADAHVALDLVEAQYEISRRHQ